MDLVMDRAAAAPGLTINSLFGLFESLTVSEIP